MGKESQKKEPIKGQLMSRWLTWELRTICFRTIPWAQERCSTVFTHQLPSPVSLSHYGWLLGCWTSSTSPLSLGKEAWHKRQEDTKAPSDIQSDPRNQGGHCQHLPQSPKHPHPSFKSLSLVNHLHSSCDLIDKLAILTKNQLGLWPNMLEL